MRVIAGSARGRKLEVPQNNLTRPTPDRVREALFSMLACDLTDFFVLDLFAGSGALGIEALSRGAKHATFVESHPVALSCLKRNLVKFSGDSKILASPVDKALRRLGQARETFDLVFIDPPYVQDLGTQTLQALYEYKVLKKGGKVVCEHSSKRTVPTPPSGWQILRARTYGEVALCIISADP